ncbi:MAG: hypothetical protein GY864_07085, partial [Desulfobacterales bacterium]|nr:hypothetical protein [Desulfobacterales bacterium]
MFEKRKANAGKIFSLLFILIMAVWLGLIHFGNADVINHCGPATDNATPVRNTNSVSGPTDWEYCKIGVGTTAAYNNQVSPPAYDLENTETLLCWGDAQIGTGTTYPWAGFIEDITFDRGVRFTLSGGYYDDFTLNPGDFSTIKGS